MIIGTDNVFEADGYFQAMKIRNNNVIGTYCNLNIFEDIPENTMLYAADCLH